MQINKIRLGMMAAFVAAAGVCTYNAVQDERHASKIKQEIKFELENNDGFPSIYDYTIAEFNEPFFNKANYWEVTADSLRREIQNEKIKKESL